MIKITSKRHLFRRGGVAHPKGPVEYADDRFTKKDLAILQAEPMLTVEVLKDEPKSDSDAKAKQGAKNKKAEK